MRKELNLRDDAAWKRRYRAPAIAWSRRATQNPARAVVCSNKDGVYQLYGWDVAGGGLTQLTHQPAGVVNGVISADGEFVYYLQDDSGSEIGHFVRLPFGGGAAEDMTPELPDYASMHISESHSGNVLGLMLVNDGGFQALVMDPLPGGAVHFRHQTDAFSLGPLLSHSGEIAVIATNEKSGSTDLALFAYDVASGEQIAELWDGAGSGISPAGFSPLAGDMRFVGSSDARGFKRPFIWNPLTGERVDIQSEHFAGDVTVWDWSDDGRRILLHQVAEALHGLYVYDVAADCVHKLDAPPGSGSGGSFVGGDRLQVHWNDSSKPSRLIELDATSGRQLRDVIDLGTGDLPDSIAWRTVSYSSADGTPIQAWLAVPPGAGPFPTIVHTHGGPTAVQTNTWSPQSQAWLDHGFAFFSLNYRGSTTFGHDFQHAIDGNLGDLEVEDIEAGVCWLIEQGIARRDAVFKTGGSYGGYLTLQALGKKPQWWAGGMALVAIADWRLMYEDQAGTLRGYQRSLFGGTPDEKPEAHRKASPISYAENLRADILVIQGTNDSRCPARQMQVYVQKLKDLNKSIEVHWFNAGHGSREMQQQIEHQELMLRFACSRLGQLSAEAEVD